MLPSDRSIISQFSNIGGIPIPKNASCIWSPISAIKNIIAKTISIIMSISTLRLSPIISENQLDI